MTRKDPIKLLQDVRNASRLSLWCAPLVAGCANDDLVIDVNTIHLTALVVPGEGRPSLARFERIGSATLLPPEGEEDPEPVSVSKIGVYRVDGADLVLVAASDDDPAIWEDDAGELAQVAISGSDPVEPGVYYVACLWATESDDDAPSIAGLNLGSDLLSGIDAELPLAATVAEQEDLPTTIALGDLVPTTIGPAIAVL